MAESFASDISDAGAIVGAAETAGGRIRAFFRGSALNAGLTEIVTLGGSACSSCQSTAFAVNGSGVVVGDSDVAPVELVLPRHAFRWRPIRTIGDPPIEDLGALCPEPACDSTAHDINDLGHIVGRSEHTSGQFELHAFLYKDNQMIDLNSLLSASAQSAWTLSQARGINALGQIAGTGLFQGEPRAFLMTPPLPAIFENMKGLVGLYLRGRSENVERSLQATLEAAQRAIARSHDQAARGLLAGFEQQVTALVQTRQLTQTHATTLTAGVTLIRLMMADIAAPETPRR
jgi:probable HAF family extracellular repeat protein